MSKTIYTGPINRQAATGLTYGPGEDPYDGELPHLRHAPGYVLTAERQKELHELQRVEKEAKIAKNAANKELRRKKKEADRLAKGKAVKSLPTPTPFRVQ